MDRDRRGRRPKHTKKVNLQVEVPSPPPEHSESLSPENKENVYSGPVFKSPTDPPVFWPFLQTNPPQLTRLPNQHGTPNWPMSGVSLAGRRPSSVERELDDVTGCIRDCLRTFACRVGTIWEENQKLSMSSRLHSSSSQTDNHIDPSLKKLTAERDALREAVYEGEAEREMLVKQIRALEAEKLEISSRKNTPISVPSTSPSSPPTSATCTNCHDLEISSSFAAVEFANQQEFYESTVRNLNLEISSLTSEVKGLKSALSEAEKINRLFSAMGEIKAKKIDCGKFQDICSGENLRRNFQQPSVRIFKKPVPQPSRESSPESDSLRRSMRALLRKPGNF